MNVTILTPEKTAFTGEAVSVKVPSADGEFQILRNHAPIVSALVTGNVNVVTDTKETLNFHINSGFVEVLNNNVAVLAQGLSEA